MWCRFSPNVLLGNLNDVLDIAVSDASKDTVQIRQVAAGILGMLLIFTHVRLVFAVLVPSRFCSQWRTCCCLLSQDKSFFVAMPAKSVSRIVATMQVLLRDSASDVRRSAAKALKRFGKVCPGFGGRMVEFVPVLVTLVKDPNTHVKLAAERALMHSLQILSDEALLRVRFTASPSQPVT
jgi:hypothetical protein